MAGHWVRVDANLAANHKTLALLEQKGGDHALCVYVFGLGYSMNQDTAGFIPRTALGLFHGRARDVALLVDVRLWIELPGGWQVNDWDEYQPGSEEANARRDRAKRAAAARWGAKPDAPSNAAPARDAMPGAMPGAMPRTNVRTNETNERNPRPDLDRHVARRAGGNR